MRPHRTSRDYKSTHRWVLVVVDQEINNNRQIIRMSIDQMSHTFIQLKIIEETFALSIKEPSFHAAPFRILISRPETSTHMEQCYVCIVPN